MIAIRLSPGTSYSRSSVPPRTSEHEDSRPVNITTSTQIRPRWLHLAAATLAIVLAVVIGGCANNGNTAVRVGDTSYSMDQLDQLTNEYLDQTGQQGIDSSQLVLIRQKIAAQLLVGEIMERAADKLGVTVSTRQVELTADQLRNSADFRQGMLTTVVPESRLDDLIRWSLLRPAVGAKIMQADAKAGGGDAVTAAVDYQSVITREVGVYVNPRIGQWSGTQLIAGGGQLVAPTDPVAAAPAGG